MAKHPGRPTKYTQELADEICRRVMESNLSKVTVDESMPSRSIIYDWLAANKDFSDNYTRANKIRREERFEKMGDIADQETDVQRARLKVDVLKWQLSKEEPKKYGDKLDHTTDGKAMPTPILNLNSINNTLPDIKPSTLLSGDVK
jgi:hypothetical protein